MLTLSWRYRLGWLGAVSLFLGMLGGCGGTGTTPVSGGPDEGETMTVGSLQVGVAATTAFRTLVLNSPGDSPVAFTALYGSKIVRLREMGYGKLAISSNHTGDYDIFTINIDGSEPINLTKKPATDIAPAWSPDGRKLAFTSYRDGNSEIYTVEADGSRLRRLTNNPTEDEDPAWSPDGREIAFTTYRNLQYDVYVMSSTGGTPTNLTPGTDSGKDPAWSPDGRQLVYMVFSAPGYDLYRMNRDGTWRENLTNTATSSESYPTWSPDGLRIAFCVDVFKLDVFVMDTNGRNLKNLTTSKKGEYVPAWSPDGRQIAYTSFSGNAFDVFVMDADGNRERNITTDSYAESDPAWCPVPSPIRTFIGPKQSDSGADPPSGNERPLAVIGQTADGVVSATSIWTATNNWDGLQVAALNNLGSQLAGLKVTGTNLRQVVEDTGRGLPSLNWPIFDTPATGAVLIFFSGETGRVASVPRPKPPAGG